MTVLSKEGLRCEGAFLTAEFNSKAQLNSLSEPANRKNHADIASGKVDFEC